VDEGNARGHPVCVRLHRLGYACGLE